MKTHVLFAMLSIIPAAGTHYLGNDPAEDRVFALEKRVAKLESERMGLEHRTMKIENRLAGPPLAPPVPTLPVMADPPTMYYRGTPIQIYQQERCVNGRCR
jgi:hypothetical protein